MRTEILVVQVEKRGNQGTICTASHTVWNLYKQTQRKDCNRYGGMITAQPAWEGTTTKRIIKTQIRGKNHWYVDYTTKQVDRIATVWSMQPSTGQHHISKKRRLGTQ